MLIAFGLPFEHFSNIRFTGFITLGVLMHFLTYAGFAFLLSVSLKKQYNIPLLRMKGETIALTISILYGTFLEFYQLLFTESRSFDWFDIAVNTTGSVAGVSAFLLIYRKIFS